MSFSEMVEALQLIDDVRNVKEENPVGDFSFGSFEYLFDENRTISYTYFFQTKKETKLISISNTFEYDLTGLYTKNRILEMINDFNVNFMGFKVSLLKNKINNNDASDFFDKNKSKKESKLIVNFATELYFHRYADLTSKETIKNISVHLKALEYAPVLFSDEMNENGIAHSTGSYIDQ